MACKTCSQPKATPIFRNGLPTIWAWGPFADHELVEDVDAYVAELLGPQDVDDLE